MKYFTVQMQMVALSLRQCQLGVFLSEFIVYLLQALGSTEETDRANTEGRVGEKGHALVERPNQIVGLLRTNIHKHAVSAVFVDVTL